MKSPDVNWLLAFILLISSSLRAQPSRIEIIDNVAQMNMEQRYRVGPDSLVITGVSDFGRSNVVYLERKLVKKDIRLIKKFIRSFPAEKLRDEYFDDYANFKLINSENYPRSITLKLVKNGKEYISKTTNVYVAEYNELFCFVNPLVPKEVRIQFDKTKFKEIPQK